MERKKLLEKLINMDGSLELLNRELANFGWDSQEDLVFLKRMQVIKILGQFLQGEIAQIEVENWAELIECREDIAYEIGYEKLISEAIFDLANPEVAGPLSKEKARILIDKLT